MSAIDCNAAPVAATDPARPAMLAGLVCYVIWGLAPLVYQPMAQAGASAWEIMGHRAVWSLLWAGGLVLISGRGGELRRVLASPRTLAWLTLSALLLSINWGVFIWAVNHGRLMEASLGYYLNPLASMAIGAWMFRERPGPMGLAAMGVAGLGVLVQAIEHGGLPVISLAVAASFAAYGVIRKRVAADAQTGLFVECLIMAPFGLAGLAWLETQGGGAFLSGAPGGAWLLLTGPVTVAPLALFAWAARRLPMQTTGFLQFIAPTLSFAVALAQGEMLTPAKMLSYGLIWAGAGLFLAATLRPKGGAAVARR